VILLKRTKYKIQKATEKKFNKKLQMNKILPLKAMKPTTNIQRIEENEQLVICLNRLRIQRIVKLMKSKKKIESIK